MSKPYLADGLYRLGMNFPITGLDGKVISTENYLEITSKRQGRPSPLPRRPGS